MNIIIERREDIIKNNNTAQQELNGILDNLDNSIDELIIYNSLYGNLDFSVLETNGFKRIKTIIFDKEGEITNISNLPSNLVKLVCSKQYLTDLENLPETLVELDCKQNYISNIDFTSLKKIKVLEISDNQFEKLENLPDTLEELYCNNNKIRKLNLANLTQLRILHSSNNKTLIIEGIPSSIVDFVSENNPFIDIEYDNLNIGSLDSEKKEERNENKIQYIDSLYDYFKLKKEYEDELHNARKKVFEKQPNKKMGKKEASRVKGKCVNCRRPVNTVFTVKNKSYIAMCGDINKPCGLKIEIYNGVHYPNDFIYINKENLDSVKTMIIKQKLDTIFNYISNEESAKIFKKIMEEYTFYNSDFFNLLEKHNDIYSNKVRNDLIERKTSQIFGLISSIKELVNEYEKTENHELLKTAIEIQVKELGPEIHNLRMLKYEIMEFDNNTNTLIQKYSSLQKLEHNVGETPTVVKWRK